MPRHRESFYPGSRIPIRKKREVSPREADLIRYSQLLKTYREFSKTEKLELEELYNTLGTKQYAP